MRRSHFLRRMDADRAGWANEWEMDVLLERLGANLQGRVVRLFQYSKGGQAYGRWHASVPSDRRNQIHQGGCLQGGCSCLEPGKEYDLKAGDGVAYELKMKIDLEHTDASRIELMLAGDGQRRTRCAGRPRKFQIRTEAWRTAAKRHPEVLYPEE